MNTKCIIILVFSVFFLLGCGAEEKKALTLSGTVDVSSVPEPRGPMFLALLTSADFDNIQSDPLESIAAVINIPDDGNFSVDLASLGFVPGDIIYCTSFVDNDYSKGIPFPTRGDFAGFYIDSNWQLAYMLGEGDNPISLRINRPVYEYDARIAGSILDEEPGTYFVVVYAGEITSLSPTALDIDSIIGFKAIVKGAGSSFYELRIIPFGYDIPIERAHVFLVRDVNGNGIPDAGDRVGFYMRSGDVVPTMLTLESGTTNNINLQTSIEIQSPSQTPLRITGQFASPAGYSSSKKPAFVIVAKSENLENLFANPLSAIKEFSRITPPNVSFDIDLSNSGLKAGDSVIVLALWDRDYKGGFPNPTALDKIGLYQNTNVSNFQYTITLKEGTNVVQPSGNWHFDINKLYYTFTTSIEFKIDPAGRPSGMDENHSLLALAVHEDGVDWLYNITDVNYILGFAELPCKTDSEYVYRFNIFPAIYDVIPDPTTMNIYVYVLYDRDDNGMPSSGDDIAAYWKGIYVGKSLVVRVPKKWLVVSDTANVLSAPNGDTKNPYAVRFLGKTY